MKGPKREKCQRSAFEKTHASQHLLQEDKLLIPFLMVLVLLDWGEGVVFFLYKIPLTISTTAGNGIIAQ